MHDLSALMKVNTSFTVCTETMNFQQWSRHFEDFEIWPVTNYRFLVIKQLV